MHTGTRVMCAYQRAMYMDTQTTERCVSQWGTKDRLAPPPALKPTCGVVQTRNKLGLCCCTQYRDVSGGTRVPAARAEELDLSNTALIQSKLFVSKRSTVEHAGHVG